MFFHLKKLASTSTKDVLCQDKLILAQWFWRRRFFNFVKVFCYFVIISLEKGRALHLKKLESDALWQVWLKLAQWFWRLKKILKFPQCIFTIFVIISPWKKAGPFIWTKLNPLQPGILCAKLGWNWPSSSGEEDF